MKRSFLFTASLLALAVACPAIAATKNKHPEPYTVVGQHVWFYTTTVTKWQDPNNSGPYAATVAAIETDGTVDLVIEGPVKTLHSHGVHYGNPDYADRWEYPSE